MLELMVSKSTQTAVILTESSKRQSLPNSSGFAELLHSNLPQSRAAKLSTGDNINNDSSVEPFLKELPADLLVEVLDTLSPSLSSFDDVTEGSQSLQVVSAKLSSTGSNLSALLSSQESGLTDIKSELLLATSSEEVQVLSSESVKSLSLEDVDTLDQPLVDSLGAVVQGDESHIIGLEVSELPISEVTSDVSESQAFNENQPLEASTPNENFVLGQNVVTPDEVVEKGLVSGGADKLGDRTSELRQEARAIKLNASSEQPATQNTTMQRHSSSEDSGQQSRGQASQQQFVNMSQLASQNTQTVREQQVERQFNTLLGERVASQTLNNSENVRLNTPSSSTETRAQLPLGLQSIGLPVTHQKWGQALGQRVVYMANQQIQQAQITLNPEKLGPVQVRLQIDKDQKVNVVMTAQHGITREAIEAAVPRLREMLEQSGINLGSVDVNDQKQFSESEKEGSENQQASPSLKGEGDEGRGDNLSDIIVHSTDNVVDYYA